MSLYDLDSDFVCLKVKLREPPKDIRIAKVSSKSLWPRESPNNTDLIFTTEIENIPESVALDSAFNDYLKEATFGCMLNGAHIVQSYAFY